MNPHIKDKWPTNDNLEIPISIHESEWEDGTKVFVLANNDDTDEAIGKVSIISQGDSLDEVKRKAIKLLKYHIHYIEKRSQRLDLWHPLQRGSWKGPGTHWFTSFGINVYFRYGKGMHGGFYIPFTKLNISVHNYWRIKKDKN